MRSPCRCIGFTIRWIFKSLPGGIKIRSGACVSPLLLWPCIRRVPAGAGRKIIPAAPGGGDIILKGKRSFWGIPESTLSPGDAGGENTLNAHCARLITCTLIAQKGRYDSQEFLNHYIAFMTAATPQHPDTYAESFHRGFFRPICRGVPPQNVA